MVPSLFAVVIWFSLGAPDAELPELARDFLLAKSRTGQAAVEKEILAVKGLTAEKLAEAIRSARVWEAQQGGVWHAPIRLRRGKASEKEVWLSVPAKYDAKKAWPLVIALHGQGASAESMLSLGRGLLGNRADEFIIAAPQDLGPLGLTEPVQVASQPRDLVVALRKMFHVDCDRVYLIGYSLGSHNAWLSIVMHADCFAGAVPLATPVQLVGNELLYDEVLPNARHVGVLFCWGAKDNRDSEGKPAAGGGNAGFARRMSAVIGALGFDHYEGIELKDAGHLGVAPPAKKLSALLNLRRAAWPKKVRQAFRLPEQSDAYWVGAQGLSGKPLTDETITVEVSPGENRQEAIRKHLVNQLGMIEAECDGQTIRLKSRRTTRVVLLLSDDLIDLDKPVVILRGKRKLYEGKIRRDLDVMLSEAARSWDFGRLPAARVVVPIGGKVAFGYPEREGGGRKKASKKK